MNKYLELKKLSKQQQRESQIHPSEEGVVIVSLPKGLTSSDVLAEIRKPERSDVPVVRTILDELRGAYATFFSEGRHGPIHTDILRVETQGGGAAADALGKVPGVRLLHPVSGLTL